MSLGVLDQNWIYLLAECDVTLEQIRTLNEDLLSGWTGTRERPWGVLSTPVCCFWLADLVCVLLSHIGDASPAWRGGRALCGSQLILLSGHLLLAQVEQFG